jgi:hypothetical protein
MWTLPTSLLALERHSGTPILNMTLMVHYCMYFPVWLQDLAKLMLIVFVIYHLAGGARSGRSSRRWSYENFWHIMPLYNSLLLCKSKQHVILSRTHPFTPERSTWLIIRSTEDVTHILDTSIYALSTTWCSTQWGESVWDFYPHSIRTNIGSPRWYYIHSGARPVSLPTWSLSSSDHPTLLVVIISLPLFFNKFPD